KNAPRYYIVDWSTVLTVRPLRATTLPIPSLECLPTKCQG
ncbi:unnamed protein product, partial [Arabidopsis halleri]